MLKYAVWVDKISIQKRKEKQWQTMNYELFFFSCHFYRFDCGFMAWCY